LGCSRDVLQINIGNKDSHDVDVEPKGDAPLNIHEDVFVIAYLQMGEVPMGLNLSNVTMFYICPNSLSGRIILFYKCGRMDECKLCVT
jgi:hypothetical protein